MHIDHDMFSELATAVYAGDLVGAQDALNLMRATAGEHVAATLIRARQVTHPIPLVDMDQPISLPQPGADPRALFGGPNPLSPRIMR